MASDPELFAIYRLEFYRKQKNWQFGQGVRRQPAKNKAVNILDTTYEVPPRCVTPPANLNNAFIESESGGSEKNSVLDPSRSLQTSSWPQSCGAHRDHTWPETKPGAELCYAPKDLHEHDDRHMSHDQVWLADSHTNAASMPSDVIWECPQSACTEVRRSNAEGLARPWTYHAATSGEDEAGGGVAGARGREDCPWKQISESPLDLECSSDSAAEFCRGAHCAPHSSEIEIPLACERDRTCASQLTNAQLRARISHTSAALTDLLNEARLRDQLMEKCASHEGASSRQYETSSFEEFPTRDVGLQGSSTPPRPPLVRDLTYTKDVFVAGSHKNTNAVMLELTGREGDRYSIMGGSLRAWPVCGRGRGRLRNNTQSLGASAPPVLR